MAIKEERSRSRSRGSRGLADGEELHNAGVWGLVPVLSELQSAVATILADSAATVDPHDDGTATLHFRHEMVHSLYSSGPTSGDSSRPASDGSSRPASGGSSWAEHIEPFTINNGGEKRTCKKFNPFWYTPAQEVDATDLHFQVLLGTNLLYWQALSADVHEAFHSHFERGEHVHIERQQDYVENNTNKVCTYRYDVLCPNADTPPQMLRVIEEQKQKLAWIDERDLHRIVGWQTNIQTQAIRLIKFSASPDTSEYPRA